MSEEVMNGTGTLFFIDEVTPITTNGYDVEFPGDFEPVVCLTDNSFDFSVAPITTSNKCNGLWASSIPGEKSGTFGMNGMAVKLADDDGRYNMNKVFELAKNGTLVWGAQFDDELYSVRYGVGYFTAYADQNPDKQAKTFSGTFTITGEIFTQTATT